MSRRVFHLSLLAAALLSAGSAYAAPRTYVASYGNDVNSAGNCAPTAPCRTFAAAMSVTDVGGEIIVLDSAGYGSVTITKSVSITAPDGVYAGLTAASGDVVTIATAGVNVALKGLTIRGGATGIYMTNGATLLVENCSISGSGNGIMIDTAATVRILNTVVRDNSNRGMRIGFGATAEIMHSQFLNNVATGMRIYGGTTETTVVNLSDTVISGSTWCVDNYPTAGTTGVLHATRVTASRCTTAFNNEPTSSTATTTVSNSTATNSSTGFQNLGGTFESLGNNDVRGNTANTSGTITVVAPN